MKDKHGRCSVGPGGFIEVDTGDTGTLQAADLMDVLRVLDSRKSGDAKVVLSGTTQLSTGTDGRRRTAYHAVERLSDIGLVKLREKMPGAAGPLKGGRQVRITHEGAELLDATRNEGKLSLSEALAKTEAGLTVAARLATAGERLTEVVKELLAGALAP